MPTRIPEGADGGLGSNGIWFLFSAICTSSSDRLGGLAVDAERPHVGEQQVRVGAAGDDAHTLVVERRRQRARVAHRALGVVLEVRRTSPP